MELRYFAAALLALTISARAQQPQDLGPFTTLSEIGDLSRKVQVSYDRSSGIYFIDAAGGLLSGERDAFGFVWKTVKGDASISARLHFSGEHAQPPGQAGLMFRQSLAPDAAYVDVVMQRGGLTSLQFRAQTGGPTREIQCTREAPTALRLERRGDHFALFAANENGAFSATGCQIRIALGRQVLAGLVVSSPDGPGRPDGPGTPDGPGSAIRFSSVSVGAPPQRQSPPVFAIETVTLDSLTRRVLWHSSDRLEVPSFTATGNAICFREGGRLQRMSLSGGTEPTRVSGNDLADCATAAPLLSSGQRLVQRVQASRSRLWLEPADGAARALTGGTGNQWLPRLAPDAASVLFISGDAKSRDGKPPLADYLLMQLGLTDGRERELAWFHGGPGSVGLSPWSGDGSQVVFVSRGPEPAR